MGSLTYLTGPTRSGKSRRAVDIASTWGEGIVFVATYRRDPDDAEMADRVRRHQAERPATWRTLEAPDDICGALAGIEGHVDGVLIDSIVLWLAGQLDLADDAIIAKWRAELDRLLTLPYPVLIVGDEIGWGPVPMEQIVRRFRDLLGLLSQETAARAEAAWLMVAGQGIRLK